MQPVPRVTQDDVERVVRRDFDAADHSAVLALLGEYGYSQEPARVRLAILKLADGDVAKVREFVDVANVDFRDVLAWAEYPEDFARPVTSDPSQAVFDRDWEQYREWFQRP